MEKIHKKKKNPQERQATVTLSKKPPKTPKGTIVRKTGNISKEMDSIGRGVGRPQRDTGAGWVVGGGVGGGMGVCC